MIYMKFLHIGHILEWWPNNITEGKQLNFIQIIKWNTLRRKMKRKMKRKITILVGPRNSALYFDRMVSSNTKKKKYIKHSKNKWAKELKQFSVALYETKGRCNAVWLIDINWQTSNQTVGWQICVLLNILLYEIVPELRISVVYIWKCGSQVRFCFLSFGNKMKKVFPILWTMRYILYTRKTERTSLYKNANDCNIK